MNDKIKENNRQKLHELLDIAIDTNGFGARKKETTGDKPTVFFFFSGHTADATFSLHIDGWVPGESADNEWWVWTDRKIEDKTVEEIREACLRALEDNDACEALRRDIERKEKSLQEQREHLKELKKELRKKEMENEADT